MMTGEEPWGRKALARRLILLLVVLVLVGLAAFWFLTAPRSFAASDLPDHKPDLANGAYMFIAGGCESCHAAKDAKGDEQLKLGGGQVLDTPFGKFHVPNISPDKEHGIGSWAVLDFVNAMKWGVGPGGIHLYPAFPYTSYQRMKMEDLIDLKAYLDTLPAVANAVPPHELPFPFGFRRGLGLWQLLYVDGKTFVPDPKASEAVNRGGYLVAGARTLRRVPHRAQSHRRAAQEPRLCRRSLARGQGQNPQHHARQGHRHRRLV